VTKNCIFAIVEIYQDILKAKKDNKKLLAVLIDPEKIDLQHISAFFEKVHQSIATHIFVGGSTDKNNQTESVITAIKKVTQLPVVLFPGDISQITKKADGILFLSLISGRNPEYLIEQQIKAVPKLLKTELEIIPTGYILIDGKKETATQKVSNTKPISQTEIELIKNTALAGEFSGKKLIYLEAGSGATVPVSQTVITLVKNNLGIPLIVGGGIRTKQHLDSAFENDENFFNQIKK